MPVFDASKKKKWLDRGNHGALAGVEVGTRCIKRRETSTELMNVKALPWLSGMGFVILQSIVFVQENQNISRFVFFYF